MPRSRRASWTRESPRTAEVASSHSMGRTGACSPGFASACSTTSHAQVDDALVGDARRPVDAHRHGSPSHRRVRCPRQHVVLGWLLQRHPRHGRLIADAVAVEEKVEDGADLVHREWLERMHRRSRRSVGHLATLRRGSAVAVGNCWIAHSFPSGSRNPVNRPHARSCTSVASTPRSRRNARAASASSTTSCSPFTEPGSESISPVPMAIEQADPGGVSWTKRSSSLTA